MQTYDTTRVVAPRVSRADAVSAARRRKLENATASDHKQRKLSFEPLAPTGVGPATGAHVPVEGVAVDASAPPSQPQRDPLRRRPEVVGAHVEPAADRKETAVGWREQCRRLASEVDDYHIALVHDEGGLVCSGALARSLEHDGLALALPGVRSLQDIMRRAMAVGPQRCYVVDMPHDMQRDDAAGFCAGIETLKNGVAYECDGRHAFKKTRFDRPQVLVTARVLPEFDLCSVGRWQVHSVRADGTMARAPDLGSP